MITEEWIKRAKEAHRLTDDDSQEIIETCYTIFGEDLGIKLPIEQLVLVEGKEMSLETQLDDARKRWVEAKKKEDIVCMKLWEKVGKSIKERIAERTGIPTREQVIENIFGQKLQETS